MGKTLAKLKIVKCNDPLMWYSDKIGELVPYLGDTGSEYRSREGAGYVNFVKREDAEVVHGQTSGTQD